MNVKKLIAGVLIIVIVTGIMVFLSLTSNNDDQWAYRYLPTFTNRGVHCFANAILVAEALILVIASFIARFSLIDEAVKGRK